MTIKRKLILLFFAILIIVIGIILAQTNKKHVKEIENLEVNELVHGLAVLFSKTSIPATVLAVGIPIYTGMISIHAKDSMEILQLTMKLRTGINKSRGVINAFEHRNQFHIVTLYKCDLICLNILPWLCKSNCLIVCDIATYDFLKTNTQFETYLLQSEWGVLKWKTLVKKTIYEIIFEKCELKRFSTIFYKTSQEREDEIREAYINERSFKAETTTGLIHGIVLKSIFPKINISKVVGQSEPFLCVDNFSNRLFAKN